MEPPFGLAWWSAVLATPRTVDLELVRAENRRLAATNRELVRQMEERRRDAFAAPTQASEVR
jgi:hypothetical protein